MGQNSQGGNARVLGAIKMKKILVIDTGFLIGNNRTPVISKIKHWQSKSAKVSVLTTKEAEINYRKFLNNVSYISIGHSKNPGNRIVLIVEFLHRNLRAFLKIKQISSKQFSTIYSLSAVLDLLIIPYALKLLGYKFTWAVVFDNTVSFNGPGNKFVRYLAYAFYRISLVLLRKADVIFVITKELKSELARIGFNDKKLVITGNAVEDDLIRNIKRPSNPQIDCLFIGRINETKGIYDLLEVTKIITEHKPDFSLHMMGRGDRSSETRFKNILKKTSLDKNINLIGFKSGIEKFKIIKSSKCFLFLSPSESFGVAVLEAVCCGLPTLVYDLDVYKKLYKNREVMMFKPGEYQQIAKKILNIMAHKKYTNPSGEKLLPKYSWNRIAQIELNKF